MISVMTENQPNTAKLRIPKMDPRTFLFFNALSEEKIARMATNAKIITVPIRHYPLCLMFFERKCDALKYKALSYHVGICKTDRTYLYHFIIFLMVCRGEKVGLSFLLYKFCEIFHIRIVFCNHNVSFSCIDSVK